MADMPRVNIQDPQLKQLVLLLNSCQYIKDRSYIIQAIYERMQEVNYKGTKIHKWIEDIQQSAAH